MASPTPEARSQKALGSTAAALGILAFLSPFWPSVAVAPYIGGLLVVAASMEIFHGLRRPDENAQRAAYFGTGSAWLVRTTAYSV